MTGKILHGDQKFLNPAVSPHSGSIRATLVKESYNNKDIDYCSALLIKDCSRTVTLDFDFHNKSGKKLSIKKANILIDVITKLRDSIDEVIV
tara:strand:- start:151 stop:426 length:276 start_codon:yes stop_codon:yes gene_type:complete